VAIELPSLRPSNPGRLNFPSFRAIDFAWHYIFELAVIALIYFFLVRLGLTLASVNPSASPVWPATGFALAILLLRGSRFWPAILLGACLGNLSSAGSIYTASAIAAGNSIEAIVAASLINRWSGGVHTFTTPGRIVKFALISTAATAISPAIGVISLSLAGHAEWSAFSSIFVTWWLGDLAGALMVAPAIVLWATAAPTRQQPTKTIAVLLVSAGIGLIAFSPIIEQTVNRTPLGFLAVVPLVWTALNRNPRDTATAAFILSAFAVWGTSAGGGPFSWAGFNNSFMLLIMFIVSVAIPSLMLSAMAAELDEAHKTLEQKVDERTRQLELANQAKSRLIAIASHDLRQPLHALGLLAAQFGDSVDPIEKGRIAGQIDTAVDSMNALFDQLLDIAKLNSGVLSPDVSEFPIASVFKIVESTFEAIARNKGLSFRIVPSRAWVRSDPVLLQRIVLNLVSNAVRYTNEGGILIGCRRRGECLHVEVWDSGLGIPDAEHQRIFAEFYRLPHSAHHSQSGLGLGLAIVERLCVLLQHSIELNSVLGKGSVFRIIVPQIAPQVEIADAARAVRDEIEKFDEKLAVIIDDDPLVLNSMAGLLEKWGCLVVASSSCEAVLNMLAKYDRPPDLIISDYHLSQGRTGIQAITLLREALGVAIPAFLMTGDTDLERLSDVRSRGYHLLKKPVSPRAMRAMLTHFFKKQAAAHPSPTGVQRQP
jgi:signal transduction histidine kinase/CheY-like chemotaxis protein